MKSLSSPLYRHRITGLLSVALLAAGFAAKVLADPAGPRPEDHQIAVAVTEELRAKHLTQHPLDKEISARCLKQFLRELDPLKLYFYQSDIDEFVKSQDSLAQLAARGDIGFAYRVFNVFLARLDERVKTADQLLAMPHDFTVDEEMAVHKDVLEYAKSPAEAWDRWRKRIKFDLLLLKADKAEKKDDKADKGEKKDDLSDGKTPAQQLSHRYHSIAKLWHQTEADELLELYLNALTTSFDPHSDYMSPSTLKDFDIMMALKLEGIGASLQSVDGYTVVKEIIPGGAAEKEGHLKREDKIVAVGEGETGEWVNVVDMKLKHVVKLIRGQPDTVVRLQVLPQHSLERKSIKITRAEIQLNDKAAASKVFNVGHKADGRPFKIGVIDLPSFYMDMDAAQRGVLDYKSATHDVKHILEGFKDQGVDAVALDLRYNGGGSLSEAISLTGLFLYDGPIVQVKGPDGRVSGFPDPYASIEWAGPLVVLTSKFSASASEIFAGAIQDYHRGLIVGDHSTHGKGTVQSLVQIGRSLFGFSAPRWGR